MILVHCDLLAVASSTNVTALLGIPLSTKLDVTQAKHRTKQIEKTKNGG